MRLSQRSSSVVGAVAVLALLVGAAPQGKAPAKGLKKVENTDTALRLKAFEQHVAMKQASPFKDV